MKITYLGSFPPPYGGVTVKNALLYEALSERIQVEKINLVDVKGYNFFEFLRFLRAVFCRDGAVVLGVSANWARRITSFMFALNRAKMRKSLLFVMGGKVPDDPSYVAKMGCYKRMYVETEGMRRAFEAMGAKNVSVYPNCRKPPSGLYGVAKTPRSVDVSCGFSDATACSFEGGKTDDPVKCVYFSLISEIKGAEIVLEAARCLPGVEFHFYGRIERGYEEDFLSILRGLNNVEYHGVFDSANGNVLDELNAYDLHLFPTKYPNEGVPGVLVETKIAAVPSIVSNCCHNAEIVKDGVDGVVLRECTTKGLIEAISYLDQNRGKLSAMKKAALASSERFYIDRYIDQIAMDLST